MARGRSTQDSLYVKKDERRITNGEVAPLIEGRIHPPVKGGGGGFSWYHRAPTTCQLFTKSHSKCVPRKTSPNKETQCVMALNGKIFTPPQKGEINGARLANSYPKVLTGRARRGPACSPHTSCRRSDAEWAARTAPARKVLPHRLQRGRWQIVSHLLKTLCIKLVAIPEPCKSRTKAEIRNYFWQGLPLTFIYPGFEHVAQV